MIRLQAALPAAPKPPPDMKFIDPHVHAMSVTPIGLRAVANWMDERNVERSIVSPLNHQGSRPQNEEERRIMLENFRPYKGRIDRMTIIDPGELETVEEAVAILDRDNHYFPALWSDPMALSGASRRKQTPSSQASAPQASQPTPNIL